MDIQEKIQTYRSYLFAIAYRMLGSVEEAEDVLQDAFIKLHTLDVKAIKNIKSYLAQVITRLCIDKLKLLEKQRQLYEGPWLPELFNTETANLTASQQLSTAFLLMLEKLNPQERAVFLLRNAFEHHYEDIALILNKSPENCRQIFRRAKLKMQTPTKSATPDTKKVEQLLQQFIQLSEAGRYTELQQLFTKDVTLIADSGGKVRGAARQKIKGVGNIMKFILGVSQKFRPQGAHYELRYLNYEPAIVGVVESQVFLVLTIQEKAEQIDQVFVHANPDKLKNI